MGRTFLVLVATALLVGAPTAVAGDGNGNGEDTGKPLPGPVTGQSTTIIWGRTGAAQVVSAAEGKAAAAAGFTVCTTAVSRPAPQAGSAYSAEFTSCTFDVVYISDSLTMYRNGYFAGSSTNSNGASNENDAVFGTCAFYTASYHTVAAMYAISSVNGAQSWVAGSYTGSFHC